jgi:hypothetical protein
MNWKGSSHDIFEGTVPEFAWTGGGNMKNFGQESQPLYQKSNSGLLSAKQEYWALCCSLC